MMVAPVFLFYITLEEINMEKINDYIEVLLADFLEGNTGGNPHAKKMIEAARELRTAIISGDDDCSEQIAELEYASERNGFYAGFMAARGLFLG